jgi:hypothetical protein
MLCQKTNNFSSIFFICYSRYLPYNADIRSKKARGKKMLSDCCGKPVYFQDICSRCGEHCEAQQDSDDGYDAARDAYDMGYGPPMNSRQRREEEMLNEEYRLNRW